MADQAAQGSVDQTAAILARAAAEAAVPGADTQDAYECPFCVMMRKGGCEDPFKAFMACGEKADKGEVEMVECLKEFEALNKCMEKNKEMFDGLLTEMKEEEDKAKQQLEGATTHEASSSSSSGGAGAGAAAGAVTAHQHAAEQEPVQQQQQQAQPDAGSSPTSGASADSSGSSRGHAGGVPATA